MKRRCMTLICALLCLGLLGGCGSEIPQLSEEDSAKVSEYAAAKLLSYDKTYHSRLLKDEEILVAQKEREEKIAREKAIADYLASQKDEKESKENSGDKGGKDGKDESQSKPSKTMAQVLGLDGIEISYVDSMVCDVYPEEVAQVSANNAEDMLASFFTMKPSNGCKLIVCKFALKNTTGQEVAVDMLSKKARFTITTSSIGRKSSMVTMLEDDFTTMSKKVAPGEQIEVALLCEAPEKQCSSLDGLGVTVKNGEESGSFTLDSKNKAL